MKIYLISYDLHTSGQNYTLLYDAIKAYEDWQHPMESLWAIYTNEDANTIYDKLRSKIDNNDSIFVVQMSSSDRQGWLPKSFWQWINEKEKSNV